MNSLKPIHYQLILVLFLMGATSCEKAILRPDKAVNPKLVFNYLWNDIHNRYSYFEFKGIDWEIVKEKYQPEIYEGMSEQELFDVLSEVLFELEDGHVNLTSPFNRSRNWEWFQNYPLNYNQGIIDRNYLGKNFWITGPLRNKIIDSVLYINYRSFTEDISDKDIEELIKRAQNMAGVIIDVRSNGGGSLNNAKKLAGAFTSKCYTYALVRIKKGSCSDCFSSWTDLTVCPKNGLRYEGSVVVLINRGSYSSTTYFAEMMRENPNATLLGDKTGGGGGTPAYGELPNGWIYRFSSTQAISKDGRHLEPGVPADIEIGMNKTDEYNGVDTILESALNFLRQANPQ